MVKLEEMADGERRKLLAMSEEDYAQVAAFCNRYPDVALDMACVGGTDVTPEDDEETKFFDVPGGGDVVRASTLRAFTRPRACVRTVVHAYVQAV